jgi:hypothetical protein
MYYSRAPVFLVTRTLFLKPSRVGTRRSNAGGAMKKLKSIEPFSAAGLLAALYTAFSIVYLAQVLITGAPTMYAPVGFALPYLNLKLDFTLPRGPLLLLSPLAYAFSGWMSGALFGFIYNLLARWSGGLRVRLEE